jgi:hypothetical protein
MILFLIILGALFFSGVRLRLFVLPLLISSSPCWCSRSRMSAAAC